MPRFAFFRNIYFPFSDSEDEGNVIQKQKPPKSSDLQSNRAEINDQSVPDTEGSSKATKKEETTSFSSEKDPSSHKEKKPLLKRVRKRLIS
ncbi:hypothetical protein TNIN_387181 [Trichonephila inaurata madagascariensis]|uniref:Uncharacterized protein n=1 Tax=Trichonephila inaurata madagascariensis TaxID=2747483 RepID=A0A8X6WST1_9ARAC|nr:hypothetical protein TNIN_387181 [Trichonephila inaurata madagascariensis]